MRIGLITDETASQLAGSGTYALKLAESLIKIDKKNDYYLIHGRKESREVYKKAKEIIVPYRQIPVLSTIRNFVTLPKAIRNYDLDIVHHPTSIGPFISKWLMPVKKGKTVQTVLDIIPLIHPESFEWQVRLTFKYFLPRILKNADKIITISNKTKTDIIDKFNIREERIEAIQLGIDNTFRKMNKKKAEQVISKKYRIQQPYILYVSTLEAKKNVTALLQAYYELRKKGIKHKLVLVGKKGYGYEKIEETINKLRIKEEVIMPGYVAKEDLPMFYNSADLFVLPSLYEGFGFPVLEAMACGCPVVCSNAGSLPEIAGNAAKVVNAEDASELSRNILEILNSSSEKRKMIKLGIINARKFSWEKCAKQTLSVYEGLCQSSY